MWIIATVSGILGFFLLLILLLAIPVDLVFSVNSNEGFQSRVRVRWLFGLIGKDIGGEKKKPAKDKEKEEEEKKGRTKLKPFLTVIKNRKFLGKLVTFIRQAFRRLKIRNLEMRLRIGLDNPADTGMLFGLIWPMTFYLKSFRSCDIHIEPDFEREDIRGHLTGDLRIFPIKFIKPLVLFLFSLTTLRAIKAMIGARRK